MTRFLFLHHCEGWHNKAASLCGPCAYTDAEYQNPSLTAAGFEQARTALSTVDVQEIAGIFCSPLQCCYQTLLVADPESKRERVVLDDQLLEPQSGFIAQRRSAAKHLNMMLPPKWILTGVSDKNPFDDRFLMLDGASKSVVLRDGLHAETDDEFNARVVAMTREIQTHYADSKVLVVAGTRWIRTWFAHFKGETPSLALGGIYVAEA